MNKDQIERDLLQLVEKEVTTWENAEIYITEQIAFHIRNLIRALRKNYYGIFDEPLDKSTGHRKIWYPLTEMIVEDTAKTVDLDVKDINVRATAPIGYSIAKITRQKLRKIFDDMVLGEVIDADTRKCLIDNIAVWKTWEHDGKLYRKTVDILNLYFDPQSESLQEAYRITERAVMTPEKIKQMSGWDNIEDMKGSTNLHPTERDLNSSAKNGTKEAQDVYELWGYIEKKYITKNENDTNEVYAHVVVSGLESGDKRVHLVEECDHNPYEEMVPAKIHGVLIGRGPAWKVLHLQEYINMVFNIRAVRSRVAQLGLWKVRRNSGISPASMSNLAINGAIEVNNSDDLTQIPMSDVQPSSYKDEDNLINTTRALTSTYPNSVGAPTPASMPATSAVLSDRNAKSAAALIQDNLGSFLERWCDRHVLPYIAKTTKKGDLVEFMHDEADFEELVDTVVAGVAKKAMLQFIKDHNSVPTQEELQAEIGKAKESMMRKKSIFLEQTGKMIVSDLVTDIYVTNEEVDPNVQVRNLLQLAGIAPQYQESITKEVMNLMNIDLKPNAIQANPTGEQPAVPTLEGLTQQANVLG